MAREWNTPVRYPWNSLIYHALKAIDRHNEEYFKTQNDWHLKKAQILREYVLELKTWIHQEEEKL